MRLSALTKELNDRGLFFPQPKALFLGYSFEAVAKGVSTIRSPTCPEHNSGYRSRSCGNTRYITPILESVDDYLCGLDLDEYISLIVSAWPKTPRTAT